MIAGLGVAVAGSLGAGARYGADSALRRRTAAPWPVLAVNVSGSLLIGVLAGLVLAHGAPTALRTVLGTGFCGGYTTFGTACAEAVALARAGRWTGALVASVGTVVLTVLAAALGLALTGA